MAPIGAIDAAPPTARSQSTRGPMDRAAAGAAPRPASHDLAQVIGGREQIDWRAVNMCMPSTRRTPVVGRPPRAGNPKCWRKGENGSYPIRDAISANLGV